MSENIVFLVDSNIESEGSTFNFIDAGIHEDISLSEIKVETSRNGNDFIAFTYTNKDGNKLVKTEWKPSIRGDQDNDALISKCKNQAKRIKHLMTKFMSPTESTIEYDYNNWDKYIQAIKTKLDPVKDRTKLRIKAIYDNNDYVSLPNYIPFAEPMSVSKADSKLKILSSDKITKLSADRESFSDNPFESKPELSEPEDNFLSFAGNDLA